MGGVHIDDEGRVHSQAADDDEDDFEAFGGDEYRAPERVADQQVTRNDAEARKVADTPHLTGGEWAEWDALELAETDPTKEPLKIQW